MSQTSTHPRPVLPAGATRILERAGAPIERLTGVPAFASLSSLVAFASLLPGLFVLYSDIAVHIDHGRDVTLLTPSHAVGVASIHGLLLGALIAVALYPQDSGKGWLLRGRRYPYGAVFAALGGMFCLLGFPFDFTWHELFGEDVTLWSPSHLQLIGGGALSVLGFTMLACEARLHRGWRPSFAGKFLMSCGVICGPVIVSVFGAEFDFGIPQFQALYLPVLTAFMTATSLVFARVMLGRGGALAAWGIWILLRGLTFLGVAALGLSEPRFLPYLLEALIVEGAFLALGSRPARAALVSGFLIGTAGCVGTFLWSRAWAYNELTWDILPQSVALSTLAGLAGAVLAVGAARAMAPDRVPPSGIRGPAVALAAAAAVVAFAVPLPRGGEKPYVADIGVEPVAGGSKVNVTARFQDPSMLEGAEWFKVFAWQGEGRVLEPMQRVGDGLYRSPVAVPITGNWKSMLRIADGSSMRAAPIRFSADSFVDAPEIPAVDRAAFAFQREGKYMMREYRGGRPALIVPGYLIHLGAWIAFFAIGTLILRRMYRDQVSAS
jgi:hypothetical protein